MGGQAEETRGEEAGGPQGRVPDAGDDTHGGVRDHVRPGALRGRRHPQRAHALRVQRLSTG